MEKLKVNDQVMVISGREKGKTGKVTSIDLKNDRVQVEGLNKYKKAVRPTQENPAGGIEDIEKPLHRSAVAVLCPKTNKPTRVRIEEREGKKVRVAIKSGEILA